MKVKPPNEDKNKVTQKTAKKTKYFDNVQLITGDGLERDRLLDTNNDYNRGDPKSPNIVKNKKRKVDSEPESASSQKKSKSVFVDDVTPTAGPSKTLIEDFVDQEHVKAVPGSSKYKEDPVKDESLALSISKEEVKASEFIGDIKLDEEENTSVASSSGEKCKPLHDSSKLTSDDGSNELALAITPENIKDSNDKKGDVEENRKKTVIPVQRSSCLYGSSCYRKNPKHREDEAHPGDEDYRDPTEEESDDGDRPECEYGAECYRRNPQHRKDFSHSNKPQPKREAKKGKKRQTKNEDDEYESDFINDEEDGWEPIDDSDEDADWNPLPNESLEPDDDIDD